MAATSGTKCRDCGCLEGELHELGCFQEKCPFCGHQLQTCNCFMEHISPRPGSRRVVGRVVDAFDGMTTAQEAEWERALGREGRIPFIVYPNLCARCGKLWPPMFMVPNDEWKGYVEPGRRREMLCRRCYGHIKKVIDAGAGRQRTGLKTRRGKTAARLLVQR
jgi:hypothetical protein